MRGTDGARRFRLGCSGGASGVDCFARLAVEQGIPWGSVECYFADERCVDPASPDANAVAIAAALGGVVDELAGFHPMSCSAGPAAYGAVVAAAGGFDLLQLGLGADGHTASLFPGADGRDAPPGTLVIANADPSGRNRFGRLSLTFEAIAGRGPSSSRCAGRTRPARSGASPLAPTCRPGTSGAVGLSGSSTTRRRPVSPLRLTRDPDDVRPGAFR